jgi:glycosyltransferase involved in cell wall biosynthesis
MNIKFSIIIPIYNASNFLEKCINSVLIQRYPSFELILVNDGSTDSSLEICNSFALLDSRVRVINIVNSGPNIARNYGLDNARGDYIIFLDSDDWLSVNALISLSSYLENYSVDIINYGFNFIDDKSDRVLRYFRFDLRLLKNKEIFVEALIGDIFLGVSWNKCYKSSLFHKAKNRFIPDRMHARDLFFTKNISLAASTCLIIPDILYHSRFRDYSFSRTFGLKNIESGLDLVGRYLKDFKGVHDGILDDLIDYSIGKHLRYLLVLSAFRSCTNLEFIHHYQLVKFSQFYRQTFFNKSFLNFYSFKDKCMLILLLHPSLTRFVAFLSSRINIVPY